MQWEQTLGKIDKQAPNVYLTRYRTKCCYGAECSDRTCCYNYGEPTQPEPKLRDPKSISEWKKEQNRAKNQKSKVSMNTISAAWAARSSAHSDTTTATIDQKVKNILRKAKLPNAPSTRDLSIPFQVFELGGTYYDLQDIEYDEKYTLPKGQHNQSFINEVNKNIQSGIHVTHAGGRKQEPPDTYC